MKEAWKTVGVVLFIVVVVVAAWWFSYGAKVLSSAPIGQGDAIIQKNSAENWTKAQADFEDLYAGIEAQDQMVTLLAEAAKGGDASTFDSRNYAGARMNCLEMVGDYNAKARSYLSADFRAADLPERIDTTMSSTDCYENKE